jgi:antibiotic biosynthesis monooxygenase (ABM) superfamily enzyme
MVMQVMKFDIHPDKTEAYVKWSAGAIKDTMGAPGEVEMRAYRTAAGTHQSVITFEFADLAAWAVWSSSEESQRVLREMHTLTLNLEIEVWGPSPLVPQPVRSGN